jgi:hypothetical protein
VAHGAKTGGLNLFARKGTEKAQVSLFHVMCTHSVLCLHLIAFVQTNGHTRRTENPNCARVFLETIFETTSSLMLLLQYCQGLILNTYALKITALDFLKCVQWE